ncbi:hypothetical protein V6N13_042698 [Hibiscus sabdariffa]
MIKLEEGQWCSNPMLIREGVVRHFKGVFQSSTVTPWDIRGRFPALTSVELEELTRAITDEESGSMGLIGLETSLA